ncbi:DUF952 domain-containing protein [Acuticoccus sediminis]|uniref:DUF952 domain-containing protein n=1 Tax=Acuticoccus sediminis TaxID=2184697 RepID=UPI001CFD6928|nr:DUF952 domain-containing protein [Acuticoccus sediminis]
MEESGTIYKLLRPTELATFVTKWTFEGSEDDVRDGFIHLSTEGQMSGTLEKHFSRDSNIFALDCSLLIGTAKLVWEPSRGGQLFPHLYRPLQMSDVRAIIPLPGKIWPVAI